MWWNPRGPSNDSQAGVLQAPLRWLFSLAARARAMADDFAQRDFSLALTDAQLQDDGPGRAEALSRLRSEAIGVEIESGVVAELSRRVLTADPQWPGAGAALLTLLEMRRDVARGFQPDGVAGLLGQDQAVSRRRLGAQIAYYVLNAAPYRASFQMTDLAHATVRAAFLDPDRDVRETAGRALSVCVDSHTYGSTHFFDDVNLSRFHGVLVVDRQDGDGRFALYRQIQSVLDARSGKRGLGGRTAAKVRTFPVRT